MNFKGFVKMGMRGNNLAMLQDEDYMAQVKVAYLTMKKESQTMPVAQKKVMEKQYQGMLPNMFKESYGIHLKEIEDGKKV